MSKPSAVDLIIHASWIIPVVPRGRILENCSIVIDKDKIVALGVRGELAQHYQPQRELELGGHALIPGLVNAHGHAAMSLMRGFADDKPLMAWLQDHIWPAERSWVSAQFVADGARLAAAEMLASGTTCFSDMYFYPENVAGVAREAGLRAQITAPVLDFPTVWAGDADEYLRKGVALHDQYRACDLITIGFGPHAPYTVSDEPLAKIATYAEELQAPIQIHLHETAEEVATAIDTTGKRPSQRLHALNLLSPLTQCVHMTQVDDCDVALLQETGAHVVHCPESNLKLASGLCPVDKLLRHGVNVCLGTDGAASNNDLDLSDEMRTAALIGKIAADSAAAVDAMTALEMATINGARAMGIDASVGSLEAGKQADIAAIDLSGIQHHPIYDPISHIVYTKAGHMVSHLWIDGKAVVSDYALTTLDVEAIKHNARAWQRKLTGKAQ